MLLVARMRDRRGLRVTREAQGSPNSGLGTGLAWGSSAMHGRTTTTDTLQQSGTGQAGGSAVSASQAVQCRRPQSLLPSGRPCAPEDLALSVALWTAGEMLGILVEESPPLFFAGFVQKDSSPHMKKSSLPVHKTN